MSRNRSGITFRLFPSHSDGAGLAIHQLKYPTAGAGSDLNVIFPIERLRELAAEGVIGGITENFFSLSATT
jgi:D-proline reductase (dithiol) PrdB